MDIAYVICQNKWLCALDFVELENYPKNVFGFMFFGPSKSQPTPGSPFGTYHDILLNEPFYCYILQAMVQLNHKFNVKYAVDEFYRATWVCAVSFSLPFPINFLRVVNWKMLQRKEK